MAVEVGNILEAKVVSIMPFGAFVSLPEGETGLVHISEIASDYVEDVKKHLKIGDAVKVKVIKIDNKGKISLSIKKALQRENKNTHTPKKIRPADIDWSKNNNENLSFEDKMNKFKMESDEKIASLKRNNDSKRSGGYRRGGGSY